MISYVDTLLVFVLVLHISGLVVWWVLWRELVSTREEVRARAEAQEERDEEDRAEARARERALGKLLAPVLRPATRPVRGFMGHRPAIEETPREPEGGGLEEVAAAAVIIYWPGLGEDAARTVREIAEG